MDNTLWKLLVIELKVDSILCSLRHSTNKIMMVFNRLMIMSQRSQLFTKWDDFVELWITLDNLISTWKGTKRCFKIGPVQDEIHQFCIKAINAIAFYSLRKFHYSFSYVIHIVWFDTYLSYNTRKDINH